MTEKTRYECLIIGNLWMGGIGYKDKRITASSDEEAIKLAFEDGDFDGVTDAEIFRHSETTYFLDDGSRVWAGSSKKIRSLTPENDEWIESFLHGDGYGTG